MGNITDIPEHLLSPDSLASFLEFLVSLPITNRRRIQLIAEWQKVTGTIISVDTANRSGIDYNV